MKKETKKNVLMVVADIGKKSAEFGSYTISLFGFHQPKEPKNIKSMLKK